MLGVHVPVRVCYISHEHVPGGLLQVMQQVKGRAEQPPAVAISQSRRSLLICETIKALEPLACARAFPLLLCVRASLAHFLWISFLRWVKT